MPLFQYHALTKQGKKLSGVLEAGSSGEAKDKLRAQGYLLTALQPISQSKGKGLLKGDQLVSFTTLLSQLVAAGMPLFESLMAIEEQYQGERFHSILVSLCEDIKGGANLSQAMARHPECFDRLYCSMIAAGEAAGILDKVLERLSLHLARQQKLKKQLTTALIYPGVLGGFALLVIVVLLTFVVPSMEPIFEGRTLNTFTRWVFGASHFIQNYWWLAIALVGSTVAWGIYKLRTPEGQLWLQRSSLKIPIIKNVVSQACLARFCRTMASLQQGGVTIVDALRVARGVIRNVVLEEEILRAEQHVMEGATLSAELKASRWIPPLLSRMVAIGEETGSVGSMFQRVAELYEEELEKSLDRTMALVQPVILVIMGGLIAMVLLSILLPLSDVGFLSQG